MRPSGLVTLVMLVPSERSRLELGDVRLTGGSQDVSVLTWSPWSGFCRSRLYAGNIGAFSVPSQRCVRVPRRPFTDPSWMNSRFAGPDPSPRFAGGTRTLLALRLRPDPGRRECRRGAHAERAPRFGRFSAIVRRTVSPRSRLMSVVAVRPTFGSVAHALETTPATCAIFRACRRSARGSAHESCPT